MLEVSVKGEVEQRLKAMTTITTSLALERFGAEEEGNQNTLNHEPHPTPLAELWNIVGKRLMTLWRTEWKEIARRQCP